MNEVTGEIGKIWRNVWAATLERTCRFLATAEALAKEPRAFFVHYFASAGLHKGPSNSGPWPHGHIAGRSRPDRA